MSNNILPEIFPAYTLSEKVRISVVVPVRDESENIEKTLRAFTRQTDLFGAKFDSDVFEILILANNCTDNSAEIIRNFQIEHPPLQIHLSEITLPEENANIGFVRRSLMNSAFERLKQNGGGVIMTTDGDTIVANDWIAANLHEIAVGADAVGGRIIITDAELEKMDALCRETHLKDEEYRLLQAEIESLIDDLPFDFAPRHHQHFNASFACTTEIYEKAGGIPDVKFLEDCAFFDRLQRIDARIRHSPDVKVYTSSRHVGRSEVGLSFQLNLWKNLRERDEDFFIESADSIVARFAAKRVLREIRREFIVENKIDDEKINSVAAQIFVPAKFIVENLKTQKTFGAFYENLLREQSAKGDWARKFPLVSLDIALEKLKDFARENARKCAKGFAK